MLPRCPYGLCSLAVINDQLTTIGGSRTNKLFSLQKGQWKEVFPPMPTKRYGTTAVTTKEHLIVAGGSTAEKVTTEEVMDTKTLV